MHFIRISLLFILTEINSISNLQSKDNNTNAPYINLTANTTPRIVSSKRRLDRVTQKRYEIVNILWRKTKIFDDFDIPNTNRTKRSKEKTSSFTQVISKAPVKKTTTTPSYIEFYYSDLNDERIKRRNSDATAIKDNINIENRSILNSPVFLFHVQYETCTKKPTETNNSHYRNKKRPFTDSHKVFKDDKTCPVTTFVSPNRTEETDIIKSSPMSTAYDKIKFFEMYDSDTPIPSKRVPHIDDDETILLEDVNFDMIHENKTRYVKKHVAQPTESNNEYGVKKTPRNYPTENFDTKKHSYNQPSLWTEFPYIALYVHEPTEVYCDAAALSPHWLLASGSCLFRHYKSYSVNGQSAFIAYCTDNWRNSGRISYVKQSFVHPQFDPKDTRRYLYNIGVIEIVNSMSETCTGWAPVSLMSHKMSHTQGIMGVAVGYGQDRYPNYKTNNTLVVRESLIYSETCPGFAEKSHKKLNVFCLTLSTSDKIENSVNGAILLIGGKLIALYSQEEPSLLGGKSLYTGVWRHIPWLLDIAREPDDFIPV